MRKPNELHEFVIQHEAEHRLEVTLTLVEDSMGLEGNERAQLVDLIERQVTLLRSMVEEHPFLELENLGLLEEAAALLTGKSEPLISRSER